MDFFGMGNAMRGIAEIYIRSARRTGRTTALLAQLKDGDRILFADQREQRRVQDLCKGLGLKVECLLIPPNERHNLFKRGTPEGRLYFDHGWLEKFYTEGIDGMVREVDHLQRELGGYGEPHIESRLAYWEATKWQR